jgi:hypothetical protein
MRGIVLSIFGLLTSSVCATLQIVPGATWTAVNHGDAQRTDLANIHYRRTLVSTFRLTAAAYLKLATSGIGTRFSTCPLHLS